MHRRHVRVVAILVAATAAVFEPAYARGQNRATPPSQPQRPAVTQPITIYESQPSYQTVNELQQLLQRYPPRVRRVLQLDPSLLDHPGYLEPYPALAAFLQQHPEVRRNPTFFFGEPERRRDQIDPKMKALDITENVLAAVAVLTGFIVAVAVLGSVARQLIE